MAKAEAAPHAFINMNSKTILNKKPISPNALCWQRFASCTRRISSARF